MSAVRPTSAAIPPEEVFGRLFNRHYGAVYAYTARRLGRELAEDATAEVFTVAWRRIRRVPEGAELPWLYGVARKVVGNQRRSLARRGRLQAKVSGQGRRAFEQVDDDLAAVLDTLSAADREVLMLAAWEGLSPDEMGQALDCSANAATVRLHRARQRLSDAWSSHDGGGR